MHTHIGQILVGGDGQPPVVAKVELANARRHVQLNAPRMVIVVKRNRQRPVKVLIEVGVQFGQVDDG